MVWKGEQGAFEIEIERRTPHPTPWSHPETGSLVRSIHLQYKMLYELINNNNGSGYNIARRKDIIII